MYRVIDVADLLGVSKVTIYKKIKLLKPGILSEMFDDNGVTYLSDAAVLMIKDSIKRNGPNQRRSEKLMEIIELRHEVEKISKELEAEKLNLVKFKNEQYEDLLLSYKYLKEIIHTKKKNLETLKYCAEELRISNAQINEQITILAKLVKTSI